MDPTTALLKTMNKLVAKPFSDFLWHLEKTQDIEKVYLEGINRHQLVDLLLQRFPQNALDVTIECLKLINRHDLVGDLSKNNSGVAGPSPGATAVNPTVDGADFVDKHKVKLIKRVSCIGPILDELLDKRVLQEEEYDKIMFMSIPQEKMRALFRGCLNDSVTAKDIFYKILEENDPMLIADLKG